MHTATFILCTAMCYSFMKSFSYCTIDPELEQEENIPFKFAAEPTLPELVVFNVDEIIWPYKVDEVMTPPLKASNMKYQIKDRMGKVFELSPDAGRILEELFHRWYSVGGLVQSTDVGKIEEIMNLFDIDKFFKYFEVFPKLPGSKIKHLTRISERAKVPLEDVLYFDSNKEDLEEMRNLGITSVYVDPKEGITYKHATEGFRLYFKAKNHTLSYHYALATTAQPA
ncbi:magnesium-dependent phosphatase 1-like [Homalodisca vitripennis]|uniref:magnesium-dependent phosphatase 1-like n=1 Tax=Homalodisca vitripennis TaxID=197043 RepID=UPI001EEAA582|nr:magnesium-dependent phosphatase 1-like [Homalodisca vitripennis]